MLSYPSFIIASRLIPQALGEEAFTKVWEEGRAMTPEQAVAYAKEEYDT